MARAAGLWIALLFTVIIFFGCASTGGGTWFGDRSEKGDEPWLISESAYPTQRLYRVRYEGPEGRLSFKLTLYLEGESRFKMRAADALGRGVWELSVDRFDEALWLDHKNKRYCKAAGASQMGIVPLARLPLISLPKLLLGHLPAMPASDLERTETSVYYRDIRGQLWNGGLAEGQLTWWTLVEDGEAITWWRREGEESVFIDLRGDQQLRWREVVREPLAQPSTPLLIPPRYTKTDCG